jgi:hypothetical protein
MAEPNARKDHFAGNYPLRRMGFISTKQIGLGDLINRGTSLIGIRPCAGCQRRAATLRRRLLPGGRLR